jgi:hypothetical protein
VHRRPRAQTPSGRGEPSRRASRPLPPRLRRAAASRTPISPPWRTSSKRLCDAPPAAPPRRVERRCRPRRRLRPRGPCPRRQSRRRCPWESPCRPPCPCRYPRPCSLVRPKRSRNRQRRASPHVRPSRLALTSRRAGLPHRPRRQGRPRRLRSRKGRRRPERRTRRPHVRLRQLSQRSRRRTTRPISIRSKPRWRSFWDARPCPASQVPDPGATRSVSLSAGLSRAALEQPPSGRIHAAGASRPRCVLRPPAEFRAPCARRPCPCRSGTSASPAIDDRHRRNARRLRCPKAAKAR